MMRRPVKDDARFERLWTKHVAILHGAYQMNEEPAARSDASVADVA